jgi:hypothetical protein
MIRSSYLVGACYDARKLALLFILTVYYSFDNLEVVRFQVDKAVGYTGLFTA